MSKNRNHYTPEEKVSIICQHLIEKVAVADICTRNHAQRDGKLEGAWALPQERHQKVREQKRQEGCIPEPLVSDSRGSASPSRHSFMGGRERRDICRPPIGW